MLSSGLAKRPKQKPPVVGVAKNAPVVGAGEKPPGFTYFLSG